MDTIAEIKQALEAITPGKWEWHHTVGETDAIVGYDGLRSWAGKGADAFEEDVLSWRKEAWIAVSPPDASFIAAAPDWLRELLPVVDAAWALNVANDDEDMESFDRALKALQDALGKLQAQEAGNG